MKKFAITLSVTTLLLGGLIGCGTDQQGTDGLGGQDQRGLGYHTTDQQPRTGITGQRAGEGPITDMFTRDDRRGARGLGREERRPTTGLTGERGLTGQRDGQGRVGMIGQDGTDGVGGMTGAGAGPRGTGAGMRGTQFGNQGRDGMAGTGAGPSGTGAGMHGTQFGNQGRDGMTGTRTRHGTMGLGDTGTQVRDHGRGIVGGNRSGYVDDRGILRGRGTTGRAGIGGLGQTGENLQGNRTGMGKDGIGQTGRLGAAGDRSRMNEFSYPTGYDGATVQRINTRLADVENVRSSRVIVHENRYLIGVEANGKDTQRIEQDVRRTVGNMVGDKEVVVVTGRDQYNQVRSADDRLRGGEAFEEVGSTINEMFQDFGRAIQRPFERSR
ncbi:YhcN/YlaJ family sporulation lipoprotein [Bacillaceae bacterium IKA-2]|nr:YhcN/YlaJ family sporulation lipoprotein [Bacillaceae bacterium IKA-2]